MRFLHQEFSEKGSVRAVNTVLMVKNTKQVYHYAVGFERRNYSKDSFQRDKVESKVQDPAEYVFKSFSFSVPASIL